jgi:hypothetical protein
MRAVLLLAAAVAAGTVVVAAAASDGVSPVVRTGPPAPSLEALAGVNFVSACGFSHRRMDDPIVYPGQPGASHDHSFVGNRSTNAFSTLKSLLRFGATTCHRPADTAAYWLPTLVVGDRMVAPRRAQVYYRRGTLAQVTPFSPGLRVIAGNARATEPQGRRITSWNCGPNADVPPSETVPTCPDAAANSLRLRVRFPDCWDGRRLDSVDHQRHMAYSVRGYCSATHPVAVPAITIIYTYPVTGGPGTSLASGNQFSAHADFFNAWQQAELERLVDVCLNALRHCQRDG